MIFLETPTNPTTRLVRVAVGIEDVDDLLEDMTSALDAA